jgi:hypothetical protein
VGQERLRGMAEMRLQREAKQKGGYMRLDLFLACTAIGLSLVCATPAARAQTKLKVSTVDGGSVTTNLGHGIAVNKNSSLRRQWFIINDPTCPLTLTEAGINTTYRDRQYSFKPAGSIKTIEAVAAFEVRFMLFDVWGNHMKTLSGTELRDLKAGVQLALSEVGSWRAWETEVTKYLTSVGFIAHARTVDGRPWTADTEALLREVDAVKLKLTQEQLEPEKPK